MGMEEASLSPSASFTWKNRDGPCRITATSRCPRGVAVGSGVGVGVLVGVGDVVGVHVAVEMGEGVHVAVEVGVTSGSTATQPETTGRAPHATLCISPSR